MRLIDADELSKNIHDNVSTPYEDAVAAKEDCLREIEEAPTVDAVGVVHGRLIYHNRPVYYERYERADHRENGEPLYRHKCFLLQDNPVAYCSRCRKRLCSNFENYCPACGAKMDGKDEDDAN